MNSIGIKIKSLSDIQAITTRIAWQIFEEHYRDDKIVLAGISPQGTKFAQMIVQDLKKISELKVDFIELEVDKKNPTNKIKALPDKIDTFQLPLVVVDDVLNTGQTISYAVGYFLKNRPSRITTAVLVNRSHGRFPVKVDFKGVSLSTTSQEHIEVILEGDNSGVYLR
ncbi:MAG: phosphoribosyltransferase family protein [Flavobacteriaceae bacterium]|nr:phosphoribosyltransferase family protein [Flavobacteriaceae bacterium]